MKGIFLLIASVIIYLINGSAFCWGNWHPYLISFLKNSNQYLVLSDGLFFFPIGVLILNLNVMTGGLLMKYIGLKNVFTLGFSLIFIGYLILSFSYSYILDLFSLVLIGLGSGLNIMPPLLANWLYFPDKKGMVAGIVMCGFGISPTFFNLFSTYIINPKSLEPSLIIDGEAYFSNEVTQNVQKFFFYLSFVFLFLAVIIYIFIHIDYDALLLSKISNQKREKNEFLIEGEDEEPVLVAFKSERYIYIVLMATLSVFYFFTVTNTNKSFGLINGIDEQMLIVIVTIFSLFHGLSRLVFGILADKFKFRTLFRIILVLSLISSSLFYYSVKFKYLYFFLNVIASICMGGIFGIHTTFVQSIFGIKNSSILSGFITICFGISIIGSPLLIKLIVVNPEDYQLFYFLSSFFTFLSLLICQFKVKEDKFNYKKINSE